MSSKIQQQPVYLLLLPVFFVLHGYAEEFQYIHLADLVIPTLTYLLETIGITFLCWLLFRDVCRSAMAAFALMSFYFFFGALHDFLKTRISVGWISSYTFLLLSFPLLFITLLFYLKKTSSSFRLLTVFLNLLFLVYMLIDTTSVVSKAMSPVKNSLSVYSSGQGDYKVCDTCAKPDIYFLLMDEYASSLSLKQLFNFDNNLDSFLLKNNFSIQTHSFSNYNITPFSMASMLNMSYLKGIKNINALDANDFLAAQLVIRNNEVIKTLKAEGYDIVNYSVFNLKAHPSLVRQFFIPFNTDLIAERTLFWNIRKDIGWKLVKWYPFKWIWGTGLMICNRNNEKIINLVEESTHEKSSKPRFIYAHFFMPHSPYYYDSRGRLKDIQTIADDINHPTAKAYLNYLPYVNARIQEMITDIRHKNPSAIIILMGDHGFRSNTPPDYWFKNLNAIYYPDKDYRLLYDSISCVNQFRVVFNKLFKQSIPLVKDSSAFLTIREVFR
jgi:hypothetical protein